jgi:hypothetical protein
MLFGRTGEAMVGRTLATRLYRIMRWSLNAVSRPAMMTKCILTVSEYGTIELKLWLLLPLLLLPP